MPGSGLLKSVHQLSKMSPMMERLPPA
jgi:hypothetical protein